METLLNLQYWILIKIRILQMKNRDQISKIIVKIKKNLVEE